MMAEQPKATGAREPGTNRGMTRVIEKPTSYSEAGIDKNLAHRARTLARMTPLVLRVLRLLSARSSKRTHSTLPPWCGGVWCGAVMGPS
jgi:hypothetical protein